MAPFIPSPLGGPMLRPADATVTYLSPKPVAVMWGTSHDKVVLHQNGRTRSLQCCITNDGAAPIPHDARGSQGLRETAERSGSSAGAEAHSSAGATGCFPAEREEVLLIFGRLAELPSGGRPPHNQLCTWFVTRSRASSATCWWYTAPLSDGGSVTSRAGRQTDGRNVLEGLGEAHGWGSSGRIWGVGW